MIIDPAQVRHKATFAGIAATRAKLLSLNAEGAIEDAVMHQLEDELDSNEMRVKHRIGSSHRL